MHKHKKFKQLAMGQKFIFASEINPNFSGISKGPWIKLSGKRYSHAVTGTQHTVGSINVNIISNN